MIIILGSGRSGTTWLAKMFDSHPGVVYRHEPDSLNVNTAIPFLPRRDEAHRYAEPTRGYLNELKRARYVKSVGPRPFFKKTFQSLYARYGLIGSTMALKGIERCGGRVLASNKLCIPRWFDAPLADAADVVVKSVNSLCRAYLFSLAAPDARIVHMVRHPCAVVASQLRGIAKGLMSPATYLQSVLSMEEVDRYPLTHEYMTKASLEEQIAYQWMVFNDKVLTEMRDCVRYKTVVYEELCADPASETRGLFAFANLDWNAQTERFIHRLETSGKQPDRYFGVLRSPTSAVDDWRQQLREEQIARILAICSYSRIKEIGLRL